MALRGGHRFSVTTDEVFPHGCYAVGQVEQVRDFDKSTRDNFVQATDPQTGQRVYSIQVMDGDPEVKGQAKTQVVKVSADVQPVPPTPPAGMPEGLPFTPVAFDGLTVTPYANDKGRIAYSLRATGITSPVSGGTTAAATANGSSGKASAGAAKSGSEPEG